MTRKEIKAKARAQLGGNIFSGNWLYAVLVILILGALMALPNGILGVGTVGVIIITGPLTYGVAKMFLKQSRDGAQMNVVEMFDGFKDDISGTIFLNVVIAVFTFLWSLLFVIPGIIKGYSYSMAYFVKADHPEFTYKQCIDESMRITNGHKMELFILDLSFIGWFIVGSICFGFGTLWVTAYQNAAKAQFYETIK